MELRALVEAPALRARTTDPDAALVAAAREQPQAFLALYDRYFDRVLGYARLRIRDESTCEDIASTVFTTALEQIRRFRGDGTFAGWLFQIARNTVRDVQRRPAAVPLPAEGTVSEPDLEQRLLAHERVGHLRTLVRLLKPEQQHLLALRYGAGLAFDSPTQIDPVEIVRAELIAGTAQVVGTVTIDGQPFYRIDLPGGAVGYFDQTDYRPVYLDNPQTDGSIVRTHVITYEELSLTPDNAQLLSVTAQHPNASVETKPSADQAEINPARRHGSRAT
jgi:RNA polymerase sigma-70 factor (ECF subfamily)